MPKKATEIDDKPTAYTPDEVRQQFLDNARMIARYWAAADLTKARPPQMPELTPLQERLERAEGVVFSMLALLDGVSDGFPAVLLTVEPHPSDKEFHRSRGERWYEPGMSFNGGVYMHDELGHKFEGTLDSIVNVVVGLAPDDRKAVIGKILAAVGL